MIDFKRAELNTLKTQEVFTNCECRITVLETKQNYKNTAEDAYTG